MDTRFSILMESSKCHHMKYVVFFSFQCRWSLLLGCIQWRSFLWDIQNSPRKSLSGLLKKTAIALPSKRTTSFLTIATTFRKSSSISSQETIFRTKSSTFHLYFRLSFFLFQTLLNTPQGRFLAPLLEQMGVTRAIPLSQSSSSAPALQSSQFSQSSQSSQPHQPSQPSQPSQSAMASLLSPPTRVPKQASPTPPIATRENARLRASSPAELAQTTAGNRQSSERNALQTETAEDPRESPFAPLYSEAKASFDPDSAMEIVHSEELMYKEIDLACLAPWRRFDSKFLGDTLLLLGKKEPFCSGELIQYCFDLLQRNTLCYTSLRGVEATLDHLITTHAAPFLLEILLLIAIPHFTELSKACRTRFEPLCSLRSSLLSLLFRLHTDSAVSPCASWLALLGLSALMTRELWKELENSACFHELFNACQQRENDDEHQQIAKLCLLATCCRFVEVSRDDVDASEACLEVEEREGNLMRSWHRLCPIRSRRRDLFSR